MTREMSAVEDLVPRRARWSPRGPTTWRWMRLIQCASRRFSGGAAASRSALIAGLFRAASRDLFCDNDPARKKTTDHGDTSPPASTHRTRLRSLVFASRSNRSWTTSTFPILTSA